MRDQGWDWVAWGSYAFGASAAKGFFLPLHDRPGSPLLSPPHTHTYEPVMVGAVLDGEKVG